MFGGEVRLGWLGHESVETTHIYLQADLATKEPALAKLALV
jgi:integrase/recombinase XerD